MFIIGETGVVYGVSLYCFAIFVCKSKTLLKNIFLKSHQIPPTKCYLYHTSVSHICPCFFFYNLS